MQYEIVRRIAMEPVINMQSILDSWEKYYKKYSGLYAFLLYSQVDRDFSRYIRTVDYWNDLHVMSTDKCLIFVFEEPEEDLQFWSFVLDEDENSLVDEQYKTRPYSFQNIYKIVDEFKIPYKELPCIVFFKDLEDADICWVSLKIDKEDEYYRSNPDEFWTFTFRELFWMIETGLENKKAMFEDFKSRLKKREFKIKITNLVSKLSVILRRIKELIP